VGSGRSVVGPDSRKGIELVVEARAHDVVGDAGIEADGERSRICRQNRGGRDVTEIQVKIFDLAGPVAPETDLRAGANRPPCLRLLAEEGGACGVGAGDDEGDIDREFDGVTIGVDIDGDAVGETRLEPLMEPEVLILPTARRASSREAWVSGLRASR
jgi:hypothetical protein